MKNKVYSLLGRLHAKIGDFWWYSLMIFCAARAADCLNIFVGLWLVPKYVPPSELGAVQPLTSFASLLAIPAGVFASFRRGEGGHQSIVLVNFTDKPASGEFELPQDFGMQSKKDTKAVDLMTGRMFNAVNGRIFKYALKPRGYTVLRTNSAPLGSAMPGMNEGLDPDIADVLQLED